MKQYDYLIIGSGLFGAVFGYMAKQAGKRVLVIEKRNHSGGNIACENIESIPVHKYGPHIFHTSNKEVWDFVNSFVEFNRYTNCSMANFKGKLYNLPFNMNTFYQLWGVTTPQEAQNKIAQQVAESGIKEPKNLEEQAISLVGKDIYEILIKEYTEKQWGRKATELPAFIIKRLPVRFTFDNNYFNDKYQGIPVGGYNGLTDKLLNNIEVKLSTDYFSDRNYFDALSEKIVFTGKIDEFFDYTYGQLEYRSLRFEHEVLDLENYQGNALVNYTDAQTPFTRICEHKHFDAAQSHKTVITREFPCEWDSTKEPYYPINNTKNENLYNKYKVLAETQSKVIFGGRLAEYKYYDMHQVIENALQLVKE